MLCQFERLIYPQNVSSIDAGSFMIAVYRPCENIRDSAGNMVTQVKAVGYCLPIADNLRYELQGHWSKNPKHGVHPHLLGQSGNNGGCTGSGSASHTAGYKYHISS